MSIENTAAVNENIRLEEQIEENKFLTFMIGDEQYGVSIEHVIEIIEVIKITPMPDMNEYIKGVINLRGKVIPVMDVRLRFGMEEREHDEKTCIVVVKINEFEIGLIADTVSEVTDIPETKIEPPPKMHTKANQNFVMGVGKVGKQVKILLDLNKLLFLEELEKIKEASQ